jgi:pimeloyl-ACP methyl ester carboxylesterase
MIKARGIRAIRAAAMAEDCARASASTGIMQPASAARRTVARSDGMVWAFERGHIRLRVRMPGCALLLALVALAAPVRGEVQPFPAAFRVQEVQTDGAVIHARIGGAGPAVVLLHGFGDTGDMWAPVAAALMKDHTVLVPDLRGMGLSSHPEGGYDKKTQARDVAQVMDKLGIDKAALVTHDIGNMVGYAFAAQFPARVTRWVVIDAPLPGIGPWDEILRSPALWHFNFRGPDVERLVQGRERIYLDRFWNELSADPKAIDEATRQHYAALYARPGAMHSAFNQFAAFTQDAADNKVFAAQGKLTMPVLALGADHSFGTQMADVLRFVASDVTTGVIGNTGHWVMEEQPARTTAAIVAFIAGK